MRYVKITAEALATIKSRRELPPPEHDPHPVRRCPEGYEVWFDDEVIGHLKSEAFEGETVSETIIRLAARKTAGGRPR